MWPWIRKTEPLQTAGISAQTQRPPSLIRLTDLISGHRGENTAKVSCATSQVSSNTEERGDGEASRAENSEPHWQPPKELQNLLRTAVHHWAPPLLDAFSRYTAGPRSESSFDKMLRLHS